MSEKQINEEELKLLYKEPAFPSGHSKGLSKLEYMTLHLVSSDPDYFNISPFIEKCIKTAKIIIKRCKEEELK